MGWARVRNFLLRIQIKIVFFNGVTFLQRIQIIFFFLGGGGGGGRDRGGGGAE